VRLVAVDDPAHVNRFELEHGRLVRAEPKAELIVGKLAGRLRETRVVGSRMCRPWLRGFFGYLLLYLVQALYGADQNFVRKKSVARHQPALEPDQRPSRLTSSSRSPSMTALYPAGMSSASCARKARA
jgi:hypothetical protein